MFQNRNIEPFFIALNFKTLLFNAFLQRKEEIKMNNNELFDPFERNYDDFDYDFEDETIDDFDGEKNSPPPAGMKEKGETEEKTEDDLFLAFLLKKNPAKNVHEISFIDTAALFGEAIAKMAVYVPENGFATYDGKRWVFQKDSYMLQRYAKDFAKAFKAYTDLINDSYVRKSFEKMSSRLDKTSTRTSLVKEAVSEESCDGAGVIFDEGDFLNVENGTIDLSTLTFRPHDRRDMLTHFSSVTYDPTAKSPLLENTLFEIANGNEEWLNYLQLVFGYCISKNTDLDKFFVFYGKKGRNGKGTITDMLKSVLGDYAATMEGETLYEKKYTDASKAKVELDWLKCKNVAVLNENEKGKMISSGLLKSMTGSDFGVSRGLYENLAEYRHTAKIIICCNSLPRITDRTVFESNRAIVIPFNNSFICEDCKASLRRTLQTDETAKSAFLSWILEGRRRLLADENAIYDMPASVKNETKAYAESVLKDPVDAFIEKQLVYKEGAAVSKKELYEVFYAYAITEFAPSMIPPKHAFFEKIAKKGYVFLKHRFEGGPANYYLDNYTLIDGLCF